MVKSRRRHRRRRNDKRKSLRKRGGVRHRSTSPVGAPEHEPDRNINKLKHFYVEKLQKDSGSFEPGALTQGHFMFGQSLYGNEIPVKVVDIRSMITGRSLFDSDPDPIHPDKYKGVVTLSVHTQNPTSLRLQKQTDSGEYVRGNYYTDNFINYRINVDPATTLDDRSSKHELGLLHQLTFVEPN